MKKIFPEDKVHGAKVLRSFEVRTLDYTMNLDTRTRINTKISQKQYGKEYWAKIALN